MKINFGVAAVYHCAGGPVENMLAIYEYMKKVVEE